MTSGFLLVVFEKNSLPNILTWQIKLGKLEGTGNLQDVFPTKQGKVRCNLMKSFRKLPTYILEVRPQNIPNYSLDV